ncbi:hypothetical protein B0H19DRAFT_1155024 [Mycena capillaripes]|nr:hypothetical protein B0H19DRAFT_1155024 [Mycena capillaripes]
MDPSLTPAEELQRLPLNSPIVEIFLNGIYTCLFIFAIGKTWMNPKKSHRRELWTGIMVLLYSFATIHSAVQWEAIMRPFQYYGTSPGLLNELIHPNLNLKILALVASFLSFVLADMIMVWRCWIIWGCSWVVVVIPILAAIAGTVCAGLGLAGQIAVASIENSTTAMRLAPLARFSTPFLSLSLAVTLYTTGLIAWRILHVQRYAAQLGVRHISSDLTPILEILIESSALYAASLFIFVVFLAMKSPNQAYMQDIHPQIAGIAPTLLILRISAGTARKDEEWSAPTSGLRFASTESSSLEYDAEGGSDGEPSEASSNSVNK